MNSSMTDATSPLRNRPLSTRMQETCGPTASASSGGDHRGIDPARQPADDPVFAHAAGGSSRSASSGEIAHPPRAGTAADRL